MLSTSNEWRRKRAGHQSPVVRRKTPPPGCGGWALASPPGFSRTGRALRSGTAAMQGPGEPADAAERLLCVLAMTLEPPAGERGQAQWLLSWKNFTLQTSGLNAWISLLLVNHKGAGEGLFCLALCGTCMAWGSSREFRSPSAWGITAHLLMKESLELNIGGGGQTLWIYSVRHPNRFWI